MQSELLNTFVNEPQMVREVAATKPHPEFAGIIYSAGYC